MGSRTRARALTHTHTRTHRTPHRKSPHRHCRFKRIDTHLCSQQRGQVGVCGQLTAVGDDAVADGLRVYVK